MSGFAGVGATTTLRRVKLLDRRQFLARGALLAAAAATAFAAAYAAGDDTLRTHADPNFDCGLLDPYPSTVKRPAYDAWRTFPSYA